MRRFIAAAALAVALWAPAPAHAQLDGAYCGAGGAWCLDVMYSSHWSLGSGTLFGFVGSFGGDALTGVKSVEFISALVPEGMDGSLRTPELAFQYHGYAGYFGLMTWDTGQAQSAGWGPRGYTPVYQDLFLSWSGYGEDGTLVAGGSCGPGTGYSCRATADVPEPAAPLLMLSGMAGLAWVTRKRQAITA